MASQTFIDLTENKNENNDKVDQKTSTTTTPLQQNNEAIKVKNRLTL